MNFPAAIQPLIQRLERERWLRGLAGLLPLAALLSAVLAWWLVRSGFDPQVVWLARGAAVLLLGLTAWQLLWRPLKRLRRSPASVVEHRAPVFAGRLQTWIETPSDNPLRHLLYQDIERIGREHPPERIVPDRRMRLAAGGAWLGAAALLILAFAGPGLLGHGVRHLWAGWAVPGLKPEQQILVTPGDQTVRRGGRLAVRAEIAGFSPATVTVHARSEGGQWRSADMDPVVAGYQFVFVGIRRPVEYYVSAAGIRSPGYQVAVVDLPRISSSSMTLHFPDWAQRAPESVDRLADIEAVNGTRVELEIETETPLPAGLLVVDGSGSTLEADDHRLRGELSVSGDGQYYVAALVGGEQVRLTQDYFISELDDEPPRIVFERPGRDRGASAVEEVTLRLSARDDYGVEDLELRYAVNGSDRPPVRLAAGSDQAALDHVLMLEELGDDGFLQPGDVISYYAVAKDRESEQASDLFFIDIQPFDRRVTQSQAAGGGAGAGREDEISQRQKEIILSTWNLQRQREAAPDDEKLGNSIRLIADLQSTLADQATTLADRARARQLGSDPAIATFIEHLDRAVEAMTPAQELLLAEALEEALVPEQQALQHLKRAEAVFSDIQVSLASSRNAGGQRSRDLAEMLELEMDLEKNQYETGSRAQPQTEQSAADETLDQLEDLARRQQRLAEEMRQGQPTPAQRWRQEALRREAERLREELQRLTASGADPSPSPASGQAEGEARDGAQRSELERRMDSAMRAMDEAQQAMAEGGDPEALQRAADEARTQLEAARRAAELDRQQNLADAFSDLAGQARDLHQRQARLERDLERAVERADRLRQNELSGLDPQEEYELAGRKRELLQDLQALDQALRVTAQEFDQVAPRPSDLLRQAANELERSEAAQRLGVAAEYIDYGAAVYIVSSEGMVTQALEELAATTRQASDLATARDLRSSDDIAQTLQQLREFRRSLDQLAEGEPVPGPPTAPGTATGRQSEEGGGYSAQGGAGGDRATTGAYFDIRERRRTLLEDPSVRNQLRQQALAAAGQGRRILPDLRGNGISAAELEAVRDLLTQLDLNQFSGNPALLDAEFSRLVSLVQQLELAISRSGGKREGTRTTAATPVPAEYRRAVAEYYRQLSESAEPAEPGGIDSDDIR